MKKIDLTKEYPHLDATYTDYPVSSDVYAVFEQSRLDEQAQAIWKVSARWQSIKVFSLGKPI